MGGASLSRALMTRCPEAGTVLPCLPYCRGGEGPRTMADEVLTVQEVAEILRTTPATVYAWCRAGKLPAFKIGQQWRIRRKALDDMMNRTDGDGESGSQGAATG